MESPTSQGGRNALAADHHFEWEAVGGCRGADEVVLAAHPYVYPDTNGRLDEHNVPLPSKNPGRDSPCCLFSGTFSPAPEKACHSSKNRISAAPMGPNRRPRFNRRQPTPRRQRRGRRRTTKGVPASRKVAPQLSGSDRPRSSWRVASRKRHPQPDNSNVPWTRLRL